MKFENFFDTICGGMKRISSAAALLCLMLAQPSAAISFTGTANAVSAQAEDGTAAAATGEEFECTVGVGTEYGTLTASNSANYAREWKSNAETDKPQITFYCDNWNNIKRKTDKDETYPGDELWCYVGNQRNTCAYKLKVDAGYVITGYSVEVELVNTNQTVQLVDGNGVNHDCSTTQTITMTGLSTSALTAFTLTGGNYGVKLKNFKVKYAKAVSNENKLAINTSTGTFPKTNDAGSYAQQWTSSQTAPSVFVETWAGTNNYNNMSVSDSNETQIVVNRGVGNSVCKLYVEDKSGKNEEYVITGYTMKVALVAEADSVTFVDSKGKVVKLTSTDPVEINVDDVYSQTVIAFSLQGGTQNSGVKITDWVVYYTSKDIHEHIVFDNTNSTVPYRIPAIAKAFNGDIIAVADYRYSKGDIGSGTLDLRIRRAENNGESWASVRTPAEFRGDGKTNSNPFDNYGRHDARAYGDPCIVGDRESAKMMITSCSGDPAFFGGTNTHHQGWARWYSDDNGETWSTTPTLLDEKFVYEPLRKAGNYVDGFFIGSGKIHQSRYVKRGKYFRLYCAGVSQTQKNGGYEKNNWVLYSDDFGESWYFLGGAKTSPVYGGDEPKVEELPNGNVLISSRKANGRDYNIYTFDATKNDGVSGEWGTKASTNFSSTGTAVTDGGTNGEIGILPVVKKGEEGSKCWLALQSLPALSGRQNVTIYYKVLNAETDYDTPANFVNNWTGSFQVSTTSSAYSTWCMQADNTLGFLYEEKSNNNGYDIVYKKFNIETITNGAYRYDDGYIVKAKEIAWDDNARNVSIAKEKAENATRNLVKDGKQISPDLTNANASILIDGKTDKFYTPATDKLYIDVDAAYEEAFNGNVYVEVVSSESDADNLRVTKFKVQGTNDGNTYTDIEAEVTMSEVGANKKSVGRFLIPEGTSYKRLRFTGYGADQDAWHVAEFQLYKDGYVDADLAYTEKNTTRNAAVASATTAEELNAAYDEFMSDGYTIKETEKNDALKKTYSSTISLVRTLVPTDWNTFCVPFDISKEKIAKVLGEGCEVMTFKNMASDGCTMIFVPSEDIKAGVPYLIKPAEKVANPVFESVAVTEVEPKTVGGEQYKMTGIYGPTVLSQTGNHVFLASGGRFLIPSNSNPLKGMRAYFQIPISAKVSEMRMDIDGELTTIDAVKDAEVISVAPVYNLNGQRVGTSLDGLSRGVYIQNGKKYVLK